MATQRDIHPRIAALAAAQHGVVSRKQLLELEVSRDAIAEAVRAKRLISLHRGVYAVGHAALQPDGYRLAAVLAAGRTAVLSHRSAAAAWGLRPHGGVHELSVPNRNGRKPRQNAEMFVHRVPGLLPHETTRVRGLPVTTVARTHLDLAAGLQPHALRRVAEQAERLELFDLRAFERLLADHGGEAGTPALRAVLADFAAFGVTLTRSELEARMLQLCLDHGLPRPQVNVWRNGRELDFRWPAARLIVETDGWGTHKTRRAFEEDRARDRRLAVEGWRVIRITHRQLRDEPDGIAADIVALLAQAA
jgi:hypothetical protein